MDSANQDSRMVQCLKITCLRNKDDLSRFVIKILHVTYNLILMEQDQTVRNYP